MYDPIRRSAPPPAPRNNQRGTDIRHVSPARLRVEAARLWEQTAPIEIGGTTVRTFTPAATLIHLAAHAAACLLNGFRLLHLVDVAWAATHFAEHAAATWQLADEWRVAPYLARVLAAAEQLFEVDLAVAAASSAPRAPRAWIELPSWFLLCRLAPP